MLPFLMLVDFARMGISSVFQDDTRTSFKFVPQGMHHERDRDIHGTPVLALSQFTQESAM